MKKTVLLSVVLSLFLSASIVGGVLWFGSRTPKMGGDFTLNHAGAPWNLTEHAKKLNLVYVGYSKCPDVCPMTLSFAAQAFRTLTPEQLEQVQFIFISVDTEHDTPQDVANYAGQFFPGFIGLTGDKAVVDSAISAIGASYILEKDPKSYLGYSISHSDRIFFLNKKAEVIDTVPNLRAEKTLVDKIKENL